jgi:hypothetical protein
MSVELVERENDYRDGAGHYLSVVVVARRERVVGGERRERSEDGSESEKRNKRDE